MINPRAYLSSVKNVRRGLEARTRIIESLAGKRLTVKELCKATAMKPSKIRYHLHNMLGDGVVHRRRKRGKVFWELTGTGQASIEEVV